MHVCKYLIHDTQIDNIPMAALYSSVTCFIKAGFPFYQIWMFYEGFKVSLVETLRNLFSSQPAGDLWLLFTLNLMRITDINTWCTKIQQGPLSLASSSLHRLHLFLFFFFSFLLLYFFFFGGRLLEESRPWLIMMCHFLLQQRQTLYHAAKVWMPL